MISHTHTIRVRYSETDQMGYVYYGNYAAYYEIARVEAMRSIGIEYAKLEQEHGIWMPVTSMQSRFIRPGRYDDELSIITEIRKIPSESITFDFSIQNAQQKLINAATVRLCFIEAASQKRIAVPDFLLDIMNPYFA